MAQFTVPGQDKTGAPQAFVVEKFGTLNTKATRPAIADEEFSWLQNWIQLGDGNMRVLHGEGATLYTASVGRTIVYVYPFNIGSTSYKAVFLDNGTAYQVRDSDGATTTISASANTFYTGSDLPACAQWKSKYLLICSTAKASNGYWIWNGSRLFYTGALSPDVLLLNSGSSYTSAPTVTAYGGSGSGAAFTASVANGYVTEVVVTNPGSGYALNDQVILGFSGGGSDTSAVGIINHANITSSSGGVSYILVTNSGTGYSSDATVTITGGGGSGAKAIVAAASNGQITALTVINNGSGYTSPPTIGITATTGSGFAATAVLKNGQIGSISLATGGTGYSTAPTVEIVGDGTGATATATIAAGAVTGFTVQNPGLGYTYARAVLTGGNNAASATVTLMPFGIKGNSIETYQSHVWISDTTKVSFSGPESTSDFSTAGGGGSFPATDSFLRRQITRLIQSNGFLYIMSDSSINVISNVSTSATTGATTFNNSNVDAQTGTAWRDSIVAFGRALVFANPTGVYALYGGAAEKVSSQLDGLFSNASFNTDTTGITPTASVFNLYGIRCYGILFTTVNPYTTVTQNLHCIWDGQKWTVGTQIKDLTRVVTQEIDSELTSWGTDGSELFPMYQQDSTSLQKIFQTKLRSDSKYFIYKQVNRFYIMAYAPLQQASGITVTIDTESSTALNPTTISLVGELIFYGPSPAQTITFIGAGSVPIVWTTGALGIVGSDVSAVGRLIGFTGETYAGDVTIISMTALYRDYAPYA